MGSERIDVHDLVGVVWHRQWQAANATARLGETADRRWVAWHSQRGKAYAYWDERSACGQLDKWLARGGWTETRQATAGSST